MGNTSPAQSDIPTHRCSTFLVSMFQISMLFSLLIVFSHRLLCDENKEFMRKPQFPFFEIGWEASASKMSFEERSMSFKDFVV